MPPYEIYAHPKDSKLDTEKFSQQLIKNSDTQGATAYLIINHTSIRKDY